MTAQSVRDLVENLTDLVENGDLGSPSLDDDASDIVAQISKICLSETGLKDLGKKTWE